MQPYPAHYTHYNMEVPCLAHAASRRINGSQMEGPKPWKSLQAEGSGFCACSFGDESTQVATVSSATTLHSYVDDPSIATLTTFVRWLLGGRDFAQKKSPFA